MTFVLMTFVLMNFVLMTFVLMTFVLMTFVLMTFVLIIFKVTASKYFYCHFISSEHNDQKVIYQNIIFITNFNKYHLFNTNKLNSRKRHIFIKVEKEAIPSEQTPQEEKSRHYQKLRLPNVKEFVPFIALTDNVKYFFLYKKGF